MLAETERGDQAIDGLSHGMATTPKGAVVTRRIAGERNTAGFEDDQLGELAHDSFCRNVITDALQHLAEDVSVRPRRWRSSAVSSQSVSAFRTPWK